MDSNNQIYPRNVALVGAGPDGGSGRAMLRIRNAIRASDLQEKWGLSELLGPGGSTLSQAGKFAEKNFWRFFSRLLYRSGHETLHSVARVPSGWESTLTNGRFDLVHLHWLGDSSLSIEQIGKINKPIVWTLHDMWPICGSEHHTPSTRYIDGYLNQNRFPNDAGPDVPRETFKRKQRSWQRRIHAVTPSEWLADATRQSILGNSWKVSVIPNPIDTNFWIPSDKISARNRLGLSTDGFVLLFGAEKGLKDRNKGGHHLPAILESARKQLEILGIRNEIKLVVFGEGKKKLPSGDAGFISVGKISSDEQLRDLYVAADVTLVPSRFESFGQVAAESMSCGTPVAGFRSTGIAEILEGDRVGVSADPFDSLGLGKKIAGFLASKNTRLEVSKQARQEANLRWSYSTVGQRYLMVYEEALADFNSARSSKTIES